MPAKFAGQPVEVTRLVADCWKGIAFIFLILYTTMHLKPGFALSRTTDTVTVTVTSATRRAISLWLLTSAFLGLWGHWWMVQVLPPKEPSISTCSISVCVDRCVKTETLACKKKCCHFKSFCSQIEGLCYLHSFCVLRVRWQSAQTTWQTCQSLSPRERKATVPPLWRPSSVSQQLSQLVGGASTLHSLHSPLTWLTHSLVSKHRR